MSDDGIFFAEDPYSPPVPAATTPSSPSPVAKPEDDFLAPAPEPDTIYYLTIATPHTDAWAFYGPTRTFAELLPLVRKTVADCPAAAEKLERLLAAEDDGEEDDEDQDGDAYGYYGVPYENQEKPAFLETGFTTFVAEAQDGSYSILRTVREPNAPVAAVLPGPVYVVSAVGPLVQQPTIGISSSSSSSSGKRVGYARTSKLIRSYVVSEEAKTAARRTMQDLVQGVQHVVCSESFMQARGLGGGLVVAFGAGRSWEVRVRYQDVLVGVRERYDLGLEGKGSWRI